MIDKKNSKEIPSIVANFFYGEIDESSVFPFPQFSKEQKEMAEEMISAMGKFSDDHIDSAKFDETCTIPEEVVRGCGELGLMGLAVEERFGGMELDYSLYARIFSELAGIDGSLATLLGAHQSIGYRALINEGTEEQKLKWLPDLAQGKKVAAFCLTEPSSGSDAYSIKTKAVKNSDGTFTITGQKLWITNAGLADFYTIFCKTNHEVNGKVSEKISCMIVEKGTEGLSFGEKENKMGIRASETRAVYLDKVVVPKENVLGELGKGFKIAMNVLNSGRLSLGSGCVGGMKKIIGLSVEHAKTRKQFNVPIADFGLIQEKIARMNAQCYASESVLYLTTANMSRGMSDYSLESAICKVFGSESFWDVVDTGLQIAAGNGYMREYPYERIMRDARINLIFEGTNEILRCLIALSGMKGPSESLKELGKISDVSKVLQDPIKSLGVLTDFAKRRIGNMFNSKALTKAHEKLSEEAEIFSSLLGSFAIQVENTLIKLGKSIIGNEFPQGRIAEVAIELYVQLAVLSRTTSILNDDKINQAKKDYVFGLAKLSLSDSRERAISALKGMTNNSDKVVQEVSKASCELDGYGLDIIEF